MTLSQPEQIRNEWTGMVPARRMAQPSELKGVGFELRTENDALLNNRSYMFSLLAMQVAT